MRRIAVVDPLPVFRVGMAAVLADEYTVDTPDDVLSWVVAVDRPLVMLTVRSAQSWATLTALAELPAVLVVALLDELTVAAAVRAAALGAVGVLDRAAPGPHIRRAVHAAFDGAAILPQPVLAALAAELAPGLDASSWEPPSDMQLRWLRELAAGSTVAHIAADAGYSERAMFRLLQSLYAQLGVRSRTEALMKAQQRGWLRT
ncbi:DNA-binding response regulator [Dactylosporangium sp. NPDC000521]|uniref:helix-turn-helix transcriptional regulator n=1 Tax=Dactylosporangium sp. NPDC000521 TaxID=3363975 RepID=UPI0036864D46